MVCGKVFTDDDDVVVCVECGTPYHRECYKQSGCINEELHKSGKSWRSQNDTEKITCKGCGKELSPDQRYCDRCGTPAGAEPHARSPHMENMQDTPYPGSGRILTLEVRPEEIADDDVTFGELAKFVGPSAGYYMPRFAMINRFGFKIGINIGALLFPELYFAYRKMPLTALGIMLIRMLLGLPSLLVMLTIPDYSSIFISNFEQFPQIVEMLKHIAMFQGAQSFTDISALISVLDTVICLALGMWANYIYYRRALATIHHLKETDNTSYIQMSGGTSLPLLILFIMMTSVRFIVSLYILNFIVT